jgi:voltage-gated sodium channel
MIKSVQKLIESKGFQHFITSLIVLNGITMGLETSRPFMAEYGALIDLFNHAVITVFVIEIALRLTVYKLSFFKSGWNLFDFFVVAISVIPASGGFEILRILRVLRLFRLVTVVPQMRKIVTALARVIPGMMSIGAILMLFFYVFAIMATQMFRDDFPQWFGTLGETFYTLFQVMTLESWSMGIVRPVMELYPQAWIFFIIFIFVATFIMVNLIVAIIVDAMSEINSMEEEHIIDEVKGADQHLAEQIRELKDEIWELKALLLKK